MHGAIVAATVAAVVGATVANIVADFVDYSRDCGQGFIFPETRVIGLHLPLIIWVYVC